jgi:hypothetical protein
MSFHVPNRYRVRTGPESSPDSYGNNGAFRIILSTGAVAFVIASDGLGWEHVSVSLLLRRHERCPTWEEMCEVKALFWDHEDCVIEYHPPESEYRNRHPYCLHLWRPVGQEIPRPDPRLVG